MRRLIGILGVAMLPSAFGATLLCPLAAPVAITSSAFLDCQGTIFDFGHDLKGNVINPLPDGGQLDLVGAVVFGGSFGIEFELNFAFPHPAIRTTVLQFSIPSPPSPFFGLGLGLDSGAATNFTISELIDGSPVLGISSSQPNVFGLIEAVPPLLVTTIITDNAGDLKGFHEDFEAPEPNSWQLLAGGLLCIGALLRFRRLRLSLE